MIETTNIDYNANHSQLTEFHGINFTTGRRDITDETNSLYWLRQSQECSFI